MEMSLKASKEIRVMFKTYILRTFMGCLCTSLVLVSSSLVTAAQESCQTNVMKIVARSRRPLSTNEIAIVDHCRKVLRETAGKKSRKAVEQRGSAVFKLGRLRHESILPMLRDIAKDKKENPQIRVRAVEGIAKIQDAAAVSALVDLVGSSSPQVYTAADNQLSYLTGASMGNGAYFGAEKFAAKRMQMQSKWRAWWARNRKTYQPPQNDVFFQE